MTLLRGETCVDAASEEPVKGAALLVTMDAAGIQTTETVAQMDNAAFEALLTDLERNAKSTSAGFLANSRADSLRSLAGIKAMQRLREGQVLSEFAMGLRDEQHAEMKAVTRHDTVARWIAAHAWSGGVTTPALRTFVFDQGTGRVGVIPASYWAAEALKPVWRDNLITLQDTTLPSNKRFRTHVGDWPAKGIVGFRHDEVEACLAPAGGDQAVVEPAADGPSC